MRKYIGAYDVAHVLGYVRAINGDQLEQMKDEGYDNNDIIGQSGVEKAAEKYLKGVDGKKAIEVDSNGRLTQEHDSVPAIPGSDVVLTVNTNLQKVAMESLKKNIDLIRETKPGKNNFGDANAGAVVALDVNTGEILAMASYPSYNPAIFLEGSENKEAQQAIKDMQNNEDKPELNRAIAGTYAPGSTFKPLTSIAALEEHVITPSWRYYDRGIIDVGGRELLCLEHPRYGHGWLDLKKGLETSCNIFFYQIGVSTGIDNLAKWAGYFGLRQKTGVELSGEKQGIMSSQEMKKKLRNDIWRPADTAQVSIGQFDNSFTPLQIANYIASIANGGKRYKPYIIKRVVKYDGSVVNESKPSFYKIPVSEANINAVKEGMVAVTSSVDGTAKEAFVGFPYTVAGKTGTAQTGREAKHSSNALFVCYAPAEKPEIAVAVVVERGAWGSNVAPIARDVLDEYFGLNKTSIGSDTAKPEEPVFTR
jgi:penicillin-binding protein 2